MAPARTLKGPMAYADIINGMEKALEHDGAKIECGTTGAAIKLVQRMNQYRILDRKRANDMRMRMELPADLVMRELEISNRNRLLYLKSRYDILIIRRFDTLVVIERRPEHPWIAFTDLNDNPVEVPPYEVLDPIILERDARFEKDFTRINEEVEREIERGNNKRSIVPDGTTQAPREKYDKPGVPLNLNEPDE